MFHRQTSSSQARNRNESRTATRWLGLLCVLALAVAGGPAFALDTIDIPMSMDGTADAGPADSGCPALTSIKYPFARCTRGADGSLRMTGAPNSREGGTGCQLRLNSGACAASPELWYPYFIGLQPPAL